jgi:hypothetical protein
MRKDVACRTYGRGEKNLGERSLERFRCAWGMILKYTLREIFW